MKTAAQFIAESRAKIARVDELTNLTANCPTEAQKDGSFKVQKGSKCGAPPPGKMYNVQGMLVDDDGTGGFMPDAAGIMRPRKNDDKVGTAAPLGPKPVTESLTAMIVIPLIVGFFLVFVLLSHIWLNTFKKGGSNDWRRNRRRRDEARQISEQDSPATEEQIKQALQALGGDAQAQQTIKAAFDKLDERTALELAESGAKLVKKLAALVLAAAVAKAKGTYDAAKLKAAHPEAWAWGEAVMKKLGLGGQAQQPAQQVAEADDGWHDDTEILSAAHDAAVAVGKKVEAAGGLYTVKPKAKQPNMMQVELSVEKRELIVTDDGPDESSAKRTAVARPAATGYAIITTGEGLTVQVEGPENLQSAFAKALGLDGDAPKKAKGKQGY